MTEMAVNAALLCTYLAIGFITGVSVGRRIEKRDRAHTAPGPGAGTRKVRSTLLFERN